MSDDADEVAELKYEAAKWKRAHDAVGEKVIEVCAENARLKAEVDSLGDTLMHAETERDAFKAEVERLRKAGDELSIALAAFHLIHRGKIDTTTQPDIVAWNAAKEGKQS